MVISSLMIWNTSPVVAEKEKFPVPKDETDIPGSRRKAGKQLVGVVNLEEGMPTVEEALADMRISLQGMRSGGFRIVKLIHGYGSTGRGGRICTAVRKELAAMAGKRPYPRGFRNSSAPAPKHTT